MHAQRRASAGTRASRSGGKFSFMHQHGPLQSDSVAGWHAFGWPQSGHRSGLKDMVENGYVTRKAMWMPGSVIGCGFASPMALPCAAKPGNDATTMHLTAGMFMVQAFIGP